MVEQMLADLAVSWKSFKYAALRYFNASGCAMDGALGEDHDPETHLIPVILQAIQGNRPGITVFGTDYPTKDGTNVRDYIHVDDLADAHIRAMEKLDEQKKILANLGTGRGFSVKEIIATAEKVTARKAPVTYGPRRPGDAIALFADPSRAKQLLGWEAKHKDPEIIIRSAWNWFSKHPRGYAG
jgi:UDP-glucose 4-epimerase